MFYNQENHILRLINTIILCAKSYAILSKIFHKMLTSLMGYLLLVFRTYLTLIVQSSTKIEMINYYIILSCNAKNISYMNN